MTEVITYSLPELSQRIIFLENELERMKKEIAALQASTLPLVRLGPG